MKTIKIYVAAIGLLTLAACKEEYNEDTVMAMTYPETKKVDTTDVYFGNEVADPYRWLEDDRSAETEEWVKAQNEVTQDYLAQIPYRDKINKRLTELWNYEKISAPFIEGDYAYYYKNDGLQNQSVLYRYQKDADPSTATVFLDPNTFAEDGTISLGGMSFTEDGSKLVYAISTGGSDWRKLIAMDSESKEIIGDTIRDVKFSGLSWYKDEDIY